MRVDHIVQTEEIMVAFPDTKDVEADQRGGAKQLGAWREDVDDVVTRLKQQGQHQLDLVGGQVRDRPVLTLLAAFGVGLLVARLVNRR